MLVSTKEMLCQAKQHTYGVGAFNLLNMEAIRGAVRAAEELQSPIIIQLAEVQLDTAPMEYIFPMAIEAAKNASVPIAVHYDHGLTIQNVLKALKYGVTSVMFDGAALPFAENVAKSKELAAIAHAFGATFEAELGVVGGAETGDYAAVEEVLTNVSEAAEFAHRTSCDFLAVAIGNAHGPYLKTPQLSVERLTAINQEVGIPLVLHGGSGLSADNFKDCITNGISKINVATSLQQNILAKLAGHYHGTQTPPLSYIGLSNCLESGVYEEVVTHIKLFRSDNQA